MNNKIVSNQNLSSLDEVTNTGTLFKNIYKPYKVVPKLIAESNEEKLLLKIQQYEIALMDLNLYLDIFPNDSSLVNLYNKYNNELEVLKKEFENKYYNLSKDTSAKNNTWKWLDGKWPWEREFDV
jgi:spore coat protein JB